MSFALWKAERKNPTPEERRTDRTTEPAEMAGYWRIIGARTKVDYPLMIWPIEGSNAAIFQIGRKTPMNTVEHPKEWDELVSHSWLKCVAVEKADWDLALDTGRWPPEPDFPKGKPARALTEAEKAGIDVIPQTPRKEGGNAPDEPPVDEDGKPLDATYIQVRDNLKKALEQAEKLGPITSLEKANQAAEIVELLSSNGSIGEAKRKAEKKPHDDAADKVQAKWVPILQPASEMIKTLRKLVQKFKDEEEARLKEEARRARVAEEKRLADEAAKRIADEAERVALATGQEMPDAEEIAEQAQEEAQAQMAQAPQVDTTVRVGTATGRGISVPKKKRGHIEDVDAFIGALRPPGKFEDWPETNDFKVWLQDKADKLARANTELAGMKITKV